MRAVVAAAAAGLPPPPPLTTSPVRDSSAAPVLSTEDSSRPRPAPPTVAVPSEEGPERVVLSEPTRVAVPAIAVDSSLVRLALDDEGRLEVPDDADVAGWWSGGTAPGAPGPAVIAGHVDSATGPAVFYRLRELRPGDEIAVAGGEESVIFEVDRVEQHPKDAFPTERIYGGTDRPTLRLITCGGLFDRSDGHYDDNVIVYATAR